MKTAKNALFAVVIILFAIGMWPVAILAGIIYLVLTIINIICQKKEDVNLKAENEKLRQELEQAQAVQRAMDQAEKKRKED